MSDNITRRHFMTAAAAAGATLLARPSFARSFDDAPKSSVVLFQGDSVTDNSRIRTISTPNDTRALGSGYPLFVAAAEVRAHPKNEISFYNRGVSGNKIPDLEARWQADTLDLKPDVLSVLIGVNDFWHTLSSGYTGTLEEFETRYRSLLQSTRQVLPSLQLVVMEPFAQRGRFVDDKWYPAFAGYQTAARRVAHSVGAVFVPLQAAFDDAAEHNDLSHWTRDGIHPTAAGQALIAERWRKAVIL